MRFKNIFLCFLCALPIYGQNMTYGYHDIHAWTIAPKEWNIIADVMAMNDTIDVLKIKESEFSGSTLSETSIGDLSGYDMGIRYGINENMMVLAKYAVENLEYGQGKLNNRHEEIIVRHTIRDLSTRALAIDIGVMQNHANPMRITDIGMINSLAKKVAPSLDGKYVVKPSGAIYLEGTDSSGAIMSVKANVMPFVSSEELKDQSLLVRLISSFRTQKGLIDFYGGGYYTKISTFIDSSINHETDSIIVNELHARNANAFARLDRNEIRAELGMNYSLESRYGIFEMQYEYNYFFRDEGLDYRNANHKISASIVLPLTKNVSAFINGKALLTQLNGEIPYLYNQYSQTSFDHKYGWAKAGITVKF